MRILYIAEIVGKAGVFAVKHGLPEVRRQVRADFVIANADGATNGRGLGRAHAAYLHKLGINALTLGEFCFYKKDLVEDFEKMPFVLRPANFVSDAPGCGARVFKIRGAEKVAVISLLGQSGFTRLHSDNPLPILKAYTEYFKSEAVNIIIDFHANATAEKRSFFAAADGLCSAIIGSHTRVQTADEGVLPKGTAFMSDAGRSGSCDSVGGTDADSRIREYITGVPEWSKEAFDNIALQGVVIETDKGGKAVSIKRVSCPIKEAFVEK